MSPIPRTTWLTAEQQRTWVAYMRVQLRMTYEMNRQLHVDSGLSLADYHVLVALSEARDRRMPITELATRIGWERTRASHHLRRMTDRHLVERVPSPDDGRVVYAALTTTGARVVTAAAPAHVDLVRRLFFDAVPDELLSTFAETLEAIDTHLASGTADDEDHGDG